MFAPMPMSDVGELIHVGTMDISKKSNYSLEGNGLSVSNCPDSWERIGEGTIHGDWFRLWKEGIRLVNYHGMTEEERTVIGTWALENGYVVAGTLYRVPCWGEDGELYFFTFASREEALEEAEEPDDISTVEGLLPTEKLLQASLVKVELCNVFSLITCLYAEQVLGYDGVYWDDYLDECRYSAPRGVIFNSRISEFTVEKLEV